MTGVREEISDLGSQLGPTPQEKQAVGTFVSDISRDVKTLVQQEVALAKAEITGQIGTAGKGVGMYAGAGLGALMTLIFLSTALWWALANLMDQSWAALIVAGVWVLISVVLFLLGRAALKSLSLVPHRTIESLKQIPAALRGQ